MTTDTTEKGLESIIVNALIDRGWLPGANEDYQRAHCVDLNHLKAFLEATQPDIAAALSLDADTPTRRQFLDRIKNQVTSRGIIDVLRNGIRHGPPHDQLLLRYAHPGQYPSRRALPAKQVLSNPPASLQQLT